MNDEQRYEDSVRSRMNDLPLPDMDSAWQNMQRRLDADGGRRRIIAFPFLSCFGVAFLALLLATGGYFLFYNKTEVVGKKQTTAQQDKHAPAEQPSLSSGQSPLNNSTTVTTTDQPKKPSNTTKTNEPTGQHSSLTAVASMPMKKAGMNEAQPPVNKRERLSNRKRTGKGPGNPSPANISKTPTQNNITSGNTVATENNQQPTVQNGAQQPAIIGHKANHSIIQQQVSDNSLPIDTAKKKEEKKSKLYITAGLGLQQSIPIGDQSAVPYNYYGRTGSLYDYIPSVYLRVHNQKWFLQTEFRFGAPQTVKEFSFAQKTKFDTASNSLSISSSRLKKTYYHQIPVTLNYQLHKNFSVGVGGMYSYFYGAVTEEETRSQNITTGEEKVARKIVPVKSFTDSFLYKTGVHLLLQTDYHWKRFNIGLRYSTDLQPYIKYTLPDGTVRTEKNHSLQIFLRYRLFPCRLK